MIEKQKYFTIHSNSQNIINKSSEIIFTNYENNIKLHFVEYLERYINFKFPDETKYALRKLKNYFLLQEEKLPEKKEFQKFIQSET